MDSMHTSPTNKTTENATETKKEPPNKARIASMVTPEQVLSASVARKRRTLTRKRSTSAGRTRAQTPGRNIPDNTSDSEDVTAPPVRPKTPERRRKRPVTRTSSNTSSRVLSSDSETKSSKNDEDKVPKVQAQVDSTKEDISAKETMITQEVTSIVEAVSPIEVVQQETTPIEDISSNNLNQPEAKLEEQVIEVVSATTNTTLEKTSNNDKETITELVTNGTKTTSPISTLERKLKPKRIQIPKDGAATSEDTSKTKSIHGPEEVQKKDSLVASTQKEIKSMLQKAKISILPPTATIRRKKIERAALQRSASQPRQLTENDLLESFRRAQQASAEREKLRTEKRSHSARKYSSDSVKSSSSTERPIQSLNKQPFRSEVNTLLEAKRKLRETYQSNKIVEILDPKTSKVIETKDVGVVSRMHFWDFLLVLRFYSPRQIYREFRKYKTDNKQEYDMIRRQRKICINHLLIMMIFCGLGGIVFKYVEGAFESFYKCGVKRVKRDFIDNLWTRSHNMREDDWKSLARNKLRNFEEELHNAHEAGMHDYSGQKSWSFLNGIVYCLTVVTTIGYGHLYPTTTTGQALTIVYSLIGIPLFLIILTDFGKLFTRCIKFLWSFVRRLYYTGSCKKVRRTAHVKDIFKGAQMMYEMATFRRPSTLDPNLSNPHPTTETNPNSNSNSLNPNPDQPHTTLGDTLSHSDTTAPTTPAISNFEIDDEFNLPISVAILLLVLYILLGAVLFSIWERWDFFTSFYFVFVSMSTIGFGDYVPRHPIFMIVSIVYLVFGLALMSMCINVVQVKLNDTFNQASAKLGATIGLNVANEEGMVVEGINGEMVVIPPTLLIPPSLISPEELLKKE